MLQHRGPLGVDRVELRVGPGMPRSLGDRSTVGARVEALGQALLDSIGPRLTGSPGMLAASDWAIAQYKSWGIDAKRENYGTWRGWRRGVSHIDLVAPRTRSLGLV